jgi:hypothetical protein
MFGDPLDLPYAELLEGLVLLSCLTMYAVRKVGA